MSWSFVLWVGKHKNKIFTMTNKNKIETYHIFSNMSNTKRKKKKPVEFDEKNIFHSMKQKNTKCNWKSLVPDSDFTLVIEDAKRWANIIKPLYNTKTPLSGISDNVLMMITESKVMLYVTHPFQMSCMQIDVVTDFKNNVFRKLGENSMSVKFVSDSLYRVLFNASKKNNIVVLHSKNYKLWARLFDKNLEWKSDILIESSEKTPNLYFDVYHIMRSKQSRMTFQMPPKRFIDMVNKLILFGKVFTVGVRCGEHKPEFYIHTNNNDQIHMSTKVIFPSYDVAEKLKDAERDKTSESKLLDVYKLKGQDMSFDIYALLIKQIHNAFLISDGINMRVHVFKDRIHFELHKKNNYHIHLIIKKLNPKFISLYTNE